jgi:hypothetical protein
MLAIFRHSGESRNLWNRAIGLDNCLRWYVVCENWGQVRMNSHLQKITQNAEKAPFPKPHFFQPF